MKRTISVMLLLALVLALLPGQAFAASWPQAYDVQFVLQDGTVIESYENVPYTESVKAPAGYKEVTTWYCADLDIEVENNEQIWADFGMDKNVVFVADSVLPESFTLNFKIPNGVKVGSVVLDPEDILDFFAVPTVDGANVEWTAEKEQAEEIKLVGNQMITGQDLDMEYVWYESNPVLDFVVSSEAVYPDAFTVKFINDNDEVVSEQTVDAWDFFTAIDVPAGNWMNYRQRVLVSEYDYISGQTLDLDFTWYGAHPVVEFFAN